MIPSTYLIGRIARLNQLLPSTHRAQLHQASRRRAEHQAPPLTPSISRAQRNKLLVPNPSEARSVGLYISKIEGSHAGEKKRCGCFWKKRVQLLRPTIRRLDLSLLLFLPPPFPGSPRTTYDKQTGHRPSSVVVHRPQSSSA